MENQSINVSVGETLSSTKRYTNLSDEAREYDIIASVYIVGDKCVNLTEGMVFSKGEGISNIESTIASFSTYTIDALSVNFHKMDGFISITESIVKFIDNVRNAVSSD